MEFMSRGNRSAQPAAAHAPHQAPAPHRPKRGGWLAKLAKVELFVVIVGAALLLALVTLYAGTTGGLGGEQKRVNENKFQAVFLNGGVTSGSVTYSTYFGKIKSINDKFLVLQNVYYLTDTQTQDGQSNPQLTKLGCQQLHSPADEMVINRSQVAFWENLEDRGKVVQAIKQFQQQNPNGPNCDTAAQPANNNSATPQNSTAPANSQTNTNTNTNRR